ncbi:MAG: ATP-binding protein [Treponema sp.]|nr:ATP-binding protein [Treponema sp.]
MNRLLQETLERMALRVHEPTAEELQEIELQQIAEWKIQELKEWKYRGVTPKYYESTWENWIADTPDKKSALSAAKQAWDKNLFFTGKNGTGKTHLAMCLAKDGATYRRLSDIFREVRTDFQRETETLDFYGNRKLLIIDEIGRQKFSDFENNLFFDIIDRRWNNVLNTTIITNLSTQEFTEIYSTAVIDRLRPVVVRFEWESQRGVKQ